MRKPSGLVVRAFGVGACLAALGAACVVSVHGAAMRDLEADTWVATDALGRQVPDGAEVGAPRVDRQVALFYFLWHGAHIQGGPYDVSRILAADPEAMSKPDSPLWGPLHAPHHWGESLFGYYLTEDEGVLRKHAQMLSDAGVDVVVFDVTNQITYPAEYRALLKVWSEMRALGNRTPAVAFLTPFWAPAKVVRELWRDLYRPGLQRDLWFQWEGKPLILADPAMLDRVEEHAGQNTPVELEPGRVLGQMFTAQQPFRGVGGRFATWRTRDAAVTLTLRAKGPGGARLGAERFHQVTDNAWLTLRLPETLPPGSYFLEASEPGGKVGWWSHSENVQPDAAAYTDGDERGGDRTLRLVLEDPERDAILEFFTFRKPQPDYFQGPTASNMWSWLEVYPQHVFRNDRGEKEQMSVGVAQNAVAGRLGAMSEPGALGRSFHGGTFDNRPGAVRMGLNVSQQWARALAEDPRILFVTGWNEWIAGRFAEFNGVRLPVMFVDQFDQEHSRDIEPMRGGHGDDYFYQFVSYVRRYKGARSVRPVVSRPIQVDGRFEDWSGVEPEFRDTIGDPVRREHRGWGTNVVYRNASGRNDLVAAKVSVDATGAWFYARTQEPLSAPGGGYPDWMQLYLDVDGDASTGWQGYDVCVNRVRGRMETSVERHAGAGQGYAWKPAGAARFVMAGRELELEVAWKQLGLEAAPERLDFKWADHCFEKGDWTDFTLNGDAAPNDRFNYRAVFPAAR